MGLNRVCIDRCFLFLNRVLMRTHPSSSVKDAPLPPRWRKGRDGGVGTVPGEKHDWASTPTCALTSSQRSHHHPTLLHRGGGHPLETSESRQRLSAVGAIFSS